MISILHDVTYDYVIRRSSNFEELFTIIANSSISSTYMDLLKDLITNSNTVIAGGVFKCLYHNMHIKDIDLYTTDIRSKVNEISNNSRVVMSKNYSTGNSEGYIVTYYDYDDNKLVNKDENISVVIDIIKNSIIENNTINTDTVLNLINTFDFNCSKIALWYDSNSNEYIMLNKTNAIDDIEEGVISYDKSKDLINPARSFARLLYYSEYYDFHVNSKDDILYLLNSILHESKNRSKDYTEDDLPGMSSDFTF